MKKQDIPLFLEKLKKLYPDATCSLDFSTPFELVIAVMLSAQCTDERVNRTTPALFEKYNTPYDFANLDVEIIENYVKPCGFYKNKAANIKKCSIQLIENFNGIVPQTIDELTTLAGIRKKKCKCNYVRSFWNCIWYCS